MRTFGCPPLMSERRKTLLQKTKLKAKEPKEAARMMMKKTKTTIIVK
jgi:hypothetical protein